MWLLLIFLSFLLCVCQSDGGLCKPPDEREIYASCSSCLSEAGSNCIWCLTPDEDKLAKGCVTKSECGNGPQIEGTANVRKDRPNTSKFIQPQKISMNLRPNIQKRIDFTAKKHQNAVDIYFLLDLSGSMNPYKEQLKKVPKDLIKVITRKTNDYRFGYGSFVEKPIFPFDRNNQNIDYSFEHIVSLNKDIKELERKIEKSTTRGNLDTPEAGFDGLLQVLLCDQDIGWEEGRTKIVVFISDALQHIAGDGLLAGITEHPKHTCSLERNSENKNVYKSLAYDYPSLSELNYLLEKKQTTIIFGIPKKSDDYSFYQMLTEEKVLLRSAAGQIDQNEGLEKLITDEYNRIENDLTIRAKVPNSAANYVQVQMKSTCPESAKVGRDLICRDVTVDDIINVSADITLRPEICSLGFKSLKIDFDIFGQSDSKLEIQIEPYCQCKEDECNRKASSNNRICNENGDGNARHVCGSCQCNQNQGEFCQCSKDGGDLEKLEENCVAGGKECSGNGECKCGQCNKSCRKGFFGKYCGCPDIDCGNNFQGQKQCEQNRNSSFGRPSCQCTQDWEGEDCSCSKRKENCMDPKTSKICNDQGRCGCNRCRCNKGFRGKFCQIEDSINQDEDACKRLAPCILLDIYGKDDEVTINSTNYDLKSYKEKWQKECDQYSSDFQYSCVISKQNTSTGGLNNISPDDRKNGAETFPEACSVITNFVPEDLKTCTIDLEFNNCAFDVMHNALEGLYEDNIYVNGEEVQAYVKYVYDGNEIESMMNQEDRVQSPKTMCRIPISMPIVLGSAGGGALLLFLIGFISYCVVMNIRDRRELREFERMKENVWEGGDVASNNLFKSIRKSVRKSIRPRESKVSFQN